MAAFAVAFDRLVRGCGGKNFATTTGLCASWEEEHLFSPRNSPPHVDKSGRFAQNPKTLEKIYVERRCRRTACSSATTRAITSAAARGDSSVARGFRSRKSIARLVALMLRRYTDGQIASGESLLDSGR